MKERMWVSNRNTWFARARDCSIWYEMEPEEKINKAEHTTMFDQEIVWNKLFFFSFVFLHSHTFANLSYFARLWFHFTFVYCYICYFSAFLSLSHSLAWHVHIYKYRRALCALLPRLLLLSWMQLNAEQEYIYIYIWKKNKQFEKHVQK